LKTVQKITNIPNWRRELVNHFVNQTGLDVRKLQVW
jgi:hypothetical protein